MKTASFFTYKSPGRISIARYKPRFTPSDCHYLPALALGPCSNSVEPAEYLVRYAEILVALDPQATWGRLHELAGEAEPVLLCREQRFRMPGNWRHRRLVADWLGHQVDEFEVPALLLTLPGAAD